MVSCPHLPSNNTSSFCPHNHPSNGNKEQCPFISALLEKEKAAQKSVSVAEVKVKNEVKDKSNRSSFGLKLMEFRCPFAILYFHFLVLWGLLTGVQGICRDGCPIFSPPGAPSKHTAFIATSFGNSLLRENSEHENVFFPQSKGFSAPTTTSPHSWRLPTLRMASVDEVDDNSKKKDNSKLEVVVLGLSHHNANVNLREKMAVPEEEWNTVSSELCKLDSISEAAVLSTCNRFELYVAGKSKYECIRDALNYLHNRVNSKGNDISLSDLKSGIFMLDGEDAIWHLMRVTAGLDSLVVGEGQILSQVKRAYERGIDVANGGCAGKVISRLFNSAITGGKRARSETGISRGAVSVSSAAAEFTSLVLEQRDIGDLASAGIVLLGAGKMARLLLIHLKSLGVQEVTVINRTPERAQELCTEFPEMTINIKGMDTIWETIRDADVVFPSTKSNVTLIDPEPLQNALKGRVKQTPLIFMDISVPRNVHPDCESDNVKCYNVDHLKAVVEKNTAKRKYEMKLAENILKEEMEKYLLWSISLDAVPTIAKLQEKAELLRAEEVQKAVKKLSNASPAEIEAVDRLSKGIVAKLLHGPMNHLRQQKESIAARTAISQLQQAFNL